MHAERDYRQAHARLRTLAAAAALGEFDVPELAAYSGAHHDAVEAVLRGHAGFFERTGDDGDTWIVADPSGLITHVRTVEATLGVPPRVRGRVAPEKERLAALLVAERALLRSWDPERQVERDVLVETALVGLAIAKAPKEREDMIAERARTVEVFARLAEAAFRGERLASERLAAGAEALVELTTSAPDRIHSFLRGLTEIARRGGGVPPFGIVSDDPPGAIVAGLPETTEWKQVEIPDLGVAVWAQPWTTELVQRRLLAGLVVQDSHFDSLHRLTTWNAPVVVVSRESGIHFVDSVTKGGAYFLSWSPPVGRVTEAFTRALEQVPEPHAASAALAEHESRAARRRREMIDAIRSGLNLHHVANQHLALLDELLARKAIEDGLSYSHLTEHAGLPDAAIDLIRTDLAPVVERTEPRPGQEEGDYRVRHDAGLLLALDIGVDHVRAAWSDLRAELPPYNEALQNDQILAEYQAFRGTKRPVFKDAKKAISWAASFLRELLGERSPEDIVGIGLALSHPIDRSGERIRGMRQANDWDHKKPVEMLRKELGWSCPILPINDANAGLLSEVRFGALQGRRDAWYVRWTRGIGGGALVDGRLFTGAFGIAAELGHLPVILAEEQRDPKPKRCEVCGHHCLQSVASAKVLEKQLRKEAQRAKERGEQLAEQPRARQRVAEYIGQALAQVTTAFNPEAIAIGGEVGDREFEEMASDITRAGREHALPPAWDQVKVVPGSRTGRAVLEGALVRVLEHEAARYLLLQALNVSRTEQSEAAAARLAPAT